MWTRRLDMNRFLFAAVALLLAGCAASPRYRIGDVTEARALSDHGFALFESGNYADAKEALDAVIAYGTIGTVTNYYGRFYSMYGSDPMGLLSWRFLVDEAGHGVSTDILSHAVDLAHYLVGDAAGPITKLVGTGETYIKQRPLPTGEGTHYDRGKPGDPTGEVTNEDYVGMMCVFGNGARGTFEVCRSVVGPESQNMFEVYGTKGSIRWNFEKMNEIGRAHV